MVAVDAVDAGPVIVARIRQALVYVDFTDFTYFSFEEYKGRW